MRHTKASSHEFIHHHSAYDCPFSTNASAASRMLQHIDTVSIQHIVRMLYQLFVVPTTRAITGTGRHSSTDNRFDLQELIGIANSDLGFVGILFLIMNPFLPQRSTSSFLYVIVLFLLLAVT